MGRWPSALVPLAAALVVTAMGCTIDNPGQLKPGTTASSSGVGGAGTGGMDTGSGGTGGAGGGMTTPTELDARVICYGDALRAASFKLIGNAPTLDKMMALENAPELQKPGIYESLIDEMLASPEFSVRMVEFWQQQFRMRNNTAAQSPSYDAAPVFAARLVVDGKPYTDLLTATSNTCPSFDPATKTFGDGECNNGIAPAGILTDPGIHSLYYGNMAFRRNRFFHETFLCRRALESVAEPTANPGAGAPAGVVYGSPWPWNSISGGPNANVDFLNSDGVVCANCHATWNHRAILFANFDDKGMYQSGISVPVPIIGLPIAQRTDWLPDGEPTAWKFGQPAADLTELGAVMAKDPEVHQCAVVRLWNYAMGRGDKVETAAPINETELKPLVDEFVANNYDQKKLLRSIFLHPDFVRF